MNHRQVGGPQVGTVDGGLLGGSFRKRIRRASLFIVGVAA